MKILRKGKPISKLELMQGVCNRCTCKVEAFRFEASFMEGANGGYFVQCPSCNYAFLWLAFKFK